jgi:3-phenylpropionate/trans-cinnamate dioxygenase ferredoxin reductase component
MTESRMVIIGSGEAGARAAVELRTQGWSGPITLIGEERLAPYERPPLSKRLLFTEEEPSPVFILDNEKLEEYDIDLLSGSSAVGIDRNNCTVQLDNGREIKYHRLLLATGARARKLTLKGSETAKLFYLRTFSDALTLRENLKPGHHIAIIGGGFIGLEAAASAIEKGCSVTLIEHGLRILMRVVPKEIADIVEARHLAAGVEFKFGVSIEKIDNNVDGQTITLGDGTLVHCDSIIVGIGAIPETSLAADCGLEIENGIRVDESLRTSDPYIFAAGDCCSFPHRLYDGRRIRVEAWRNAQDQGIQAARNMLGFNEPFEVVPWFWSDQYDLTLYVTGLPISGEKTVIRDLGDAGQLFFHFTEDGKLAAASGIGTTAISKEVRIAEMLIEKQKILDFMLFERPDVKLKSLLKDR